MRKFTSAHAKNHFGELIDAARAEPVAITKYDRTVVVMVASSRVTGDARLRHDGRDPPSR